MQEKQSKTVQTLVAPGWRKAGEGDSCCHQTSLPIATMPFLEECVLKDKEVEKKLFLLFPSKPIPLVLS